VRQVLQVTVLQLLLFQAHNHIQLPDHILGMPLLGLHLYLLLQLAAAAGKFVTPTQGGVLVEEDWDIKIIIQ
jgi:hypothetical protein